MLDQIDVACKIDTSGTRCPIPLLRAKQALKALNVGEVLEVLATDPSAKADFDSMLKHLPHEMLNYKVLNKQPRLDRFLIVKGR